MTGEGWMKVARAGFYGMAVGLAISVLAWWAGWFDKLSWLMR